MKRILFMLIGLLLMQTMVVAQSCHMPLNFKKHGWDAEFGYWRKTEYPNLAENNRGRTIRKNVIGEKVIQMAYNPQSGLVFLFLDYSSHPMILHNKTHDLLKGVRFQTPRLDEKKLKYDALGRIVEYRSTSSGYDDTYEPDGAVYTYSYYGDTEVLKTSHFKGWCDYPRDKTIRERKFPETIGCVPYEDELLYEYDAVGKKCTVHILKSTAVERSTEKTTYAKGEYNWCGMMNHTVISYDCNGNPFEIKTSRGGVYQIYYDYE